MTATSVVDSVLDDAGLRAVFEAVLAGHRTFAPVLRDGSVMLDEVVSFDELPAGVTMAQSPGSCRVEPLADGDRRRFAWAVGPASPKAVLHPPRRKLFGATTTRNDNAGDEVTVDPPDAADDRPVALFGIRPCDVAAMGVLRRVLGEATQGGDPLVVVVNCAEPGGTCFCHSMGTGPSLPDSSLDSVDVVLWERSGSGGAAEYLVAHSSPRGRDLLAQVPVGPAPGDGAEWVAHAQRAAVECMGRTLDTSDLPANILATLDSPRWDDIATRCLSCGNCTMVCPTCFCSSTQDTSDLDGTHVERWLRWDTCFSLDHSHVHGGSVRATTSDRYRQWLSHKLSTWWAQFGESGCVGCGRCIAWCPVGIDLVEEANALAIEGRARTAEDGPAPTAVFLDRREALR